MSYKRRRTYGKIAAITALDQRRTFFINIILVTLVALALIVNALFVNHLNTISFKIDDFTKKKSRLMDRKTELESRVASLQTLENIEERAVALGMVAVDEYKFLSSSETVVAQR